MHAKKIDEHSEKVRVALQGGGQDRIDSQHEKGKLTARERISILADEGSFVEIDSMATHHYHDFDMQKKIYPGDGVVGGYAKVSGRQVYVYAYDFTVLGGTLSQMGAKKITKLMDHASKNGCPIIGIMDSGGARIQEGIIQTALTRFGNHKTKKNLTNSFMHNSLKLTAMGAMRGGNVTQIS